MTVVDERDTFREAMSRFPSGVTIVTTVDQSGRPWGFTASAFASLSLQPPMVLVCLARSAECFPAFATTDSFTVNILKSEHVPLAQLFATRGADKFGFGGFTWSHSPHPAVDGALAVIHCRKTAMVDGGDHVILLGTVQTAELGDGSPTVYFARDFRNISQPG